MDTAEFSVTFGKQVFSGSTDNVTAFSLPVGGGQPWRTKSNLDKGFNKISRGPTNATSIDGYEGHGKWFTSNYISVVTRPTVLILTLNRRIEKVLRASCCLHILPHSAAPHIIVKARLTPDRLSTAGNEVSVFRGRGYVLNHRQLKELGVKISKSDINMYMDEEELEDEFTVEAVSGDPTAVPEIMRVGSAEDTDSEVIVTPPKAGRRLRVRK